MAGETAGHAQYELGVDMKPLRKGLSDAEAAIKKSGATAESAFGKQAAGGIKQADTATQGLLGRLKAMSGSGGVPGAIMGGVGLGVGFGAFDLVTSGIGAVVSGIDDAIDAASDLAESQSKVDQVFTASADTINAWADESARSFGLSKQAALEAAGTFGNFIQALGNTEDEASSMSRTLVELAADLASFNNQSIDEVLIALRSGLAGEAEPMRRLGVSISATRVEANILAKGIARSKAEITDAMKVAERYAIILEDTTKAQGDFDRTASGAANQARILDAEMADISARLGTKLIPLQRTWNELLLAGADAIGTLLEGADQDFVTTAGEVERINAAMAEMAEIAAGLGRQGGADELLREIEALGFEFEVFGGPGGVLKTTEQRLHAIEDALSAGLFGSFVDDAARAEAVTRFWDIQLKRIGPSVVEAADGVNLLETIFGKLASTVASSEAAIEEYRAAQDVARARAEELADAIEHVAQTSFPDVKQAAAEARKAINAAFEDPRDPLKKLLAEEERLAQQRRRAMREGRFDIVAMIDARQAEVRQQIEDRRTAAARYRQERRETEARNAAIATMRERLKVTKEQARTLYDLFGKDWKVKLDSGEAREALRILNAVIVKLNAIQSRVHGVIADFLGLDQNVDVGDRPRRGGRRKDGAKGATYYPGDYGYVGEYAMERIYNVGGVTHVEPTTGNGRAASLTVHVHVNAGQFWRPIEAQQWAHAAAPVIGRELQRIGY
jgi:hypothetical protein